MFIVGTAFNKSRQHVGQGENLFFSACTSEQISSKTCLSPHRYLPYIKAMEGQTVQHAPLFADESDATPPLTISSEFAPAGDQPTAIRADHRLAGRRP